MEEFSTTHKLSQYLLENYQVGLNTRGKLKVGDFSFSGPSMSGRFLNNFIIPNKKMLKEINPDWLLLSEKELKEEVTNIIPTVVEMLEDHLKETSIQNTSDTLDTPITKADYINAVPVIDMEHPKGNAIMVDKRTNRPSLITEEAWKRVVGPKHVAIVSEIAYSGRFEYNPRTVEAFREVQTEIGTETMFNKFIPPAHRIERDMSATLHPDFENFLNTFFKDSCRNYAFNWIYHSVYKKIPVYMVLVGAGGIGKNLLAESLKYLHGLTNFTKAPPSALDSKFNGHLMDATIIYYDECKFSAGKDGSSYRKNRLKEWANDYVPVEMKGIDASNRDIFCSAIIATNHDSDVYLEQLDRKFSVMELSTERLEKRIGAEKTQKLWNYIKEDTFPDALLNWLEPQIDPKFNVNVEYKGDRFHELVLSSLTSWQQELLNNYILSRQNRYYSIKKLKEDVPFFPHHTAKVNDFLCNFTFEGETLGSVVMKEGLRYVKVNDKFSPPENTQMDLDKEW